LSKDKKLQKIINSVDTPLQLEPSGNVYRELVKNIIYQQISYKAADSIYGRFMGLVDNESYTPAEVLDLEIETLRSVGLSRQKAGYIHNIASHFDKGQLLNQDWSQVTDEEIIKNLTSIKGVGVWTAKMILIFELQRPDVWPYEDLAIQQVMRELYQLRSVKKAFVEKMIKIADNWRPHRTTAGLYLWAYRRSQYEKAGK